MQVVGEQGTVGAVARITQALNGGGGVIQVVGEQGHGSHHTGPESGGEASRRPCKGGGDFVKSFLPLALHAPASNPSSLGRVPV